MVAVVPTGINRPNISLESANHLPTHSSLKPQNNLVILGKNKSKKTERISEFPKSTQLGSGPLSSMPVGVQCPGCRERGWALGSGDGERPSQLRAPALLHCSLFYMKR